MEIDCGIIENSCTNPQGKASAKTAYVPAIRSMRDYIEQHYKEELFSELARQIDTGDVPPRYDVNYGRARRESLCPGTEEIVKMSFWRQGECEVLAEIVVAAEVRLVFTKNGLDIIDRQRLEYRVPMWISLEDEIICEYGDFRHNRGEGEHEERLLNEYLIPYFGVEDIENEAEDILRLKWPEALENPLYLSPANMVDKLGLTVIRLPLYKQNKTQSILFFCDGEAIIENAYGRPNVVCVKSKTIVLNSKYPNLRQEKQAIFHECFHFMEHQLFFKLQSCSDMSMLPKWKPDQRHKDDDNPVEWMEWQARYGAQCLQMPRSMVRKFVDRALSEMKGLPLHNGEKMERIGRSLASEFAVWKYCARNRLIQVGYVAARGALNYVNSGYVRPFAFSQGECRQGQTFVIGMTDAWIEYTRNETFRKLLDTGNYIYVDGHFCLDMPEYIRRYPDHIAMTDWANAHVDQCCLRFIIQYTRDRKHSYKFGQLNSDDDYNGRNLTLSMQEDYSQLLSKAKMISDELVNMPTTFHGTLKSHMTRCGVTIEKMSELSQISERTIRRMRAGERKEYSLDHVMAICLALHLPPEFSYDLLKKAGIILRDIPQHLIYRAILRTMFMETVDDIQLRLKECGCNQLRLKDIAAL